MCRIKVDPILIIIYIIIIINLLNKLNISYNGRRQMPRKTFREHIDIHGYGVYSNDRTQRTVIRFGLNALVQCV